MKFLSFFQAFNYFAYNRPFSCRLIKLLQMSGRIVKWSVKEVSLVIIWRPIEYFCALGSCMSIIALPG